MLVLAHVCLCGFHRFRGEGDAEIYLSEQRRIGDQRRGGRGTCREEKEGLKGERQMLGG